MQMKRTIILAAAGLLFLGGCAKDTTDSDIAAIRDLSANYVERWMASDSAGVLATLTDDVILMPHNRNIIQGKDELKLFWWPPDTPPSPLTSYDEIIDEIAVSGDIGYNRGHHLVRWTYENKPDSSKGKYIKVARKGADGVWKYSRLIWNDTPELKE